MGSDNGNGSRTGNARKRREIIYDEDWELPF